MTDRENAAQRRGYSFLSSCLPDSFILGGAAAVSYGSYNSCQGSFRCAGAGVS